MRSIKDCCLRAAVAIELLTRKKLQHGFLLLLKILNEKRTSERETRRSLRFGEGL